MLYLILLNYILQKDLVMIKINNLQKFFNNECILDGINLHIKKDEFVVLLGASGSGKSTLLKILSGYESFEYGDVSVDNQNFIGKIPSHKSRQIITQQYSLLPWLSAKANIEFALKCYGFKDKKERKERAEQFLALVHLQNKADLFPHSLSGGQAQRVAIARALSLNPTILFLDEPFSALDPIVRLKLQNEIKELSINKSVIFVTHDIDEAINIADTIVILRQGKIVSKLKNPRFSPHSSNFFELKSKIFDILNGQDPIIEYMI
ncbi:TPA: ABC transporter ATP-binding protein [Campylobacter coli]|nr:ABC transporter ATP-binding protein [Campylobacter coli]EAL1122859.1 ABC transporter ATP-binding protein [Campylobacter coli]HEB7569627.1 ABC transporter ATP-binding protein [Campylobacter coli]HEB9305690.1 ABC transporter ATP-binding protein [Campylobacter coli]HEB9311942.1 ABC transporter ATP-binding protein [Campylobacter coli]